MSERALALELKNSRVAQESAPGNHPGYASVHQESSNSSINSHEFLTAKVSNSRNVFHLVCASVRNPSQKHDPMQKNHIIWPQQSVNQQSTCVTLKGRGNMYSSLKLPS
jgi:hypothetical protein